MKLMQMKAAVYHQYGSPDVIKITKVDKPAPAENDVLIKIHTTTVNSADVRLRKADPFLVRLYFGLFRPRTTILGVDIAGKIEAIGRNVTRFKVGDRVFGSTTENGFGAHAEYKVMPEDSVLTQIPDNLSYEEAASVFFGANSSLHFLKKGLIEKGKSVLIYGASGALGSYAIQLSKIQGATITAVTSTANLDRVRELGADEVIDYTKEDFSSMRKKYDIIFDTVGKSPFWGSVRSLKKQGIYLRAVHMNLRSLLGGLIVGLFTRKRVIGGVALETREALEHIAGLLRNKRIQPVIDRQYEFKDIAEAHRYVEKGHKKGSVVIRIESAGEDQ